MWIILRTFVLFRRALAIKSKSFNHRFNDYGSVEYLHYWSWQQQRRNVSIGQIQITIKTDQQSLSTAGQLPCVIKRIISIFLWRGSLLATGYSPYGVMICNKNLLIARYLNKYSEIKNYTQLYRVNRHLIKCKSTYRRRSDRERTRDKKTVGVDGLCRVSDWPSTLTTIQYPVVEAVLPV